MDVMAAPLTFPHPSIPRRESSRKRVPRSLGPDFIEHFPQRFNGTHSLYKEKAPPKSIANKKPEYVPPASKPPCRLKPRNRRKLLTWPKKVSPIKKELQLRQHYPMTIPDGATVVWPQAPSVSEGVASLNAEALSSAIPPKPKRERLHEILKKRTGSRSTTTTSTQRSSETGTICGPSHSQFPEQRCSSSEAADSLLLDEKSKKRRLMEEEDSELHRDLGMWTVAQCDTWFRDSDPELADLITNNEMYGSALVLISRNQFLELFQMPLGKALKMHAAICKWRHLYF